MERLGMSILGYDFVRGLFVSNKCEYSMTSKTIQYACPCFPDVHPETKHVSIADFVSEDGQREIEFVAISEG